MLSALLLLPLLLPVPQRPQVHAVAIINDPRSHGVVGDALLSLDETIRLANFELSQNQLSAAERGQILGVGEPSTVEIDAARVPVLRVERELTEIADSFDGFFLEGLNGTPTIDFGATRGLRTRGSFQGFRRLRFVGGDVAIDSLQDSGYHTSLVEEITCEGQRVAGMRFVSRGNAAFWRMILDDCRFVELPQALALADQGNGTTAQLDLGRVTALRSGGLDLALGSGGSMLCNLVRVACEAAPIRVLRPNAASDQSLRLDATHVLASSLRCEGHPTASSTVVLRSLDLADQGDSLWLGGTGARLDARLQDVRVRGDVRLAGAPDQAVQIDNLRHDAGALVLDVPTHCTASRLAQVAVRASAPGCALTDCDVLGGGVALQGGGVTLTRCFTDGVARDLAVQVVAPRSAAWLGAFDVVPPLPRLGGTVELRHDLPPGRLGVWLFGLTSDAPLADGTGARLYMTTALLRADSVVLQGPGLRRVPIPTDAAMRDLDLYLQGAVLPDAGAPGPALLLAPGQRLRCQ